MDLCLSYMKHLKIPAFNHKHKFNDSKYVIFSHGLAGHMNGY